MTQEDFDRYFRLVTRELTIPEMDLLYDQVSHLYICMLESAHNAQAEIGKVYNMSIMVTTLIITRVMADVIDQESRKN